MDTRNIRLLLAVALGTACTGSAFAQGDSAARKTDAADARGTAALQRNSVSDRALSAPGSGTYKETYAQPDVGVSSSPTPAIRPSPGEPVHASGTSRVAPVIENGTPMSYGQTGANAIGDTGGMTTGARGSAGIVAGGGGVHTRTGVVSPGANDGRARDAIPAGRTRGDQQPNAKE